MLAIYINILDIPLGWIWSASLYLLLSTFHVIQGFFVPLNLRASSSQPVSWSLWGCTAVASLGTASPVGRVGKAGL